jgi:hypothetical protein
MKRLLVIILVAILVGGSVVAWWLILRGPEESTAAVEPPPPPPADFVELTPMVLPLIREGRVVQHLTLKIVLEVRAGTVDEVMLVEPRLVDAFFSELHGLLAMRYVREHEDMPGFLGDRLLSVSGRLLGRDLISKVLVSELGRQKPTQS